MNTRIVQAEHSFVQRLADMRDAVRVHTQRTALNVAALAVGDLIALTTALLAATVGRYLVVGSVVELEWLWVLLPLYAVGAASTGLYPGWGMGAAEELRRTTRLLTGLFGLAVLGLFLTQQGESASRLVMGMAYLLALGLVPLARASVKDVLSRAGGWGVPTVIYGAGETGRRVVETLRRQGGLGYVPTAVFDDEPATWGTTIGGVPVVGGTRLVTSDAAVAILAMPTAGQARISEMLEGPLACYRSVVVLPDLAEAPSLWVRPRDLGGLVSLQITSNLTSPAARFLKRSFDLAAILLAAPLWVPVCAVLAALIWLEDRQTPFYAQERIGQDGRHFRALKFRTMVTDAEAVLQRYLAENAEARAEWEASFKLQNDPRITRVGRVLRRFSLDELPQLINVLRGEMSLVGPRPLPRYHHDELTERTGSLRTRVSPGLTGLWQVSGRSDLGNEGMEQLDPYYVRNWSLWLDIVVLARTVRAVAQGKGAY